MVDLILVNGLPGSGKTTLADGLARLIDVPMITKDAIKEAVADAVATPGPALGMAAGDMMWTLAAGLSGTVILESWWFKPSVLCHRGVSRASDFVPAQVFAIEVCPLVDR